MKARKLLFVELCPMSSQTLVYKIDKVDSMIVGADRTPEISVYRGASCVQLFSE